MKFKIKYETTDGLIETSMIEGASLEEALKTVTNIKTMFYHIDETTTVDKPNLDNTIADWSNYLLSEPHLSRFLANVNVQKPSFMLNTLKQVWPGIILDEPDIRKAIVNAGFTWSSSLEGKKGAGSYWNMVHDGQFDEAEEYLQKHDKIKNTYIMPA